MDQNTLKKLTSLAQAAQKKAYAPYSRYLVGCALLMEDGAIFQGANIENSCTALGNCAETLAVQYAVFQKMQKIMAVVVATANGGAPCGRCRQIIREFAHPECQVISIDQNNNTKAFHFHRELLPHSFGPEQMSHLLL
jgi:cytidine deaminase